MRFATLLALAALATACKPTSDDSRLLWGQLQESAGAKEHWLISVAPSQSITFCGDNAALAAQHAQAWAQTIGRAQNLTITGDCTAGATVAVNLYMSPGRAADHAVCKAGTNAGRGGALIPQREIVLCQPYSSSTQINFAIMHELGHFWGLCDQYNPDVPNANNCDPNPQHTSGGRVTTSVMGNSWTPTLTDDDRDGMRSLARRPDIPGHAQWQQITGQGAGTGTGTPPATTTPTTPTPTKPSTTPTTPTTPTTQSGTRTLDCNADFTAITKGGSGICRNPSSGLCYRYGSGNVSYDQGQVQCPAAGTASTATQPATNTPSASTLKPNPPATTSGACSCSSYQEGTGWFCGWRKGTQQVGTSRYGPFTSSQIDGWVCDGGTHANNLCPKMTKPAGC